MAMSATHSYPWFHSNQYTADAACEHCDGIVRHEPWCITQNLNVMNAWEPVLDPAKLSLHDQLILHALGVAWKAICGGTCNALPATP
jgi:hypothetical protein